MKRSAISTWDSEELAAHILGVTEEWEESSCPSSFIDKAFFEKFDVDFYSFHTILQYLLPLVAREKSYLTEKQYRGFTDGERWLVKEEIKQDASET